MTTIVTNPAPAEDNGGSGFMFLIGVLVLVGFVAVLLYFGIPAIRSMTPAQVSIPVDVTVTPAK